VELNKQHMARPRVRFVILTGIVYSLVCSVAVRGQDVTSDVPQGTQSTYSYPTGKRMDDYLSRTIGPEAMLNAAILGGIDQARDKPEGWEQGASGYGRRFISRFGRNGVSSTIQLAVEISLHEDTRYRAQEQGALWSRVSHSLQYSFTANTPGGRRAPPFGQLAGIVGGALISRKWYPDGENSLADGARAAGISIGVHTGMNLFREFLPDIKRLVRRK
jgi:hypothetical protein